MEVGGGAGGRREGARSSVGTALMGGSCGLVVTAGGPLGLRGRACSPGPWPGVAWVPCPPSRGVAGPRLVPPELTRSGRRRQEKGCACVDAHRAGVAGLPKL